MRLKKFAQQKLKKKRLLLYRNCIKKTKDDRIFTLINLTDASEQNKTAKQKLLKKLFTS